VEVMRDQVGRMLCYVVLEHTSHLGDAAEDESRLAEMLRHKLRFEDISGRPCLIQHYTRVTAERLAAWDVRGLLLSGNVTDWEHYDMTTFAELDRIIREGEWPILALCGGLQLIALLYEAPCGPMGVLPVGVADPDPNYHPGMLKEKGYYPVRVLDADPLFDGLSEQPVFSQWHYWELKAVPPGFMRLAESDLCRIQAIRHERRPVYGTQFHPESYSEEHSEGRRLLSNFFRICGL
jgi:GMP synthase-like glutamine amidotransferase